MNGHGQKKTIKGPVEVEKLIWEFLKDNQLEIRRRYSDSLASAKSADQQAFWSMIEKNKVADVLTCLTGMAGPDFQDLHTSLRPLLERVRTTTYSIIDLFNEAEHIESSIGDVIRGSALVKPEHLPEAGAIINRQIKSLVKYILHETAEVYEHIVETGKRGFCLFDTGGKITYANEKFKSLAGCEDLAGQALESFFRGKEKDLIKNCLGGERRLFHSLRFFSMQDTGRLVGTEVGPIKIMDEDRGGFAILTEFAENMELFESVIEGSPLGILELDLDKSYHIRYANPAAQKMLGSNDLINHPLETICNKENYAIFLRKLEERRQGKSGDYEIEFQRMDNQQALPVVLAAAPKKDINGDSIASVGIFRSTLLEKVSARIHELIYSFETIEQLLKAVMHEVGLVVPFKLCTVGIYSPDLSEGRALYKERVGGKLNWTRKWWSVSPERRERMRQQRSINIGHLQKSDFYESLKDDPQFIRFVNEHLHHYLRVPIFRNKVLVASVMLCSDIPFNDEQVKLIQSVPVAHAILTALAYEEKRELEFRLELLRQVSSEFKCMQHGGWKLIATRLAQHYGWTNAAFFKVDKVAGVFRLLAQHTEAGPPLKGGLEQPLEKGILSYAYTRKVDVNCGNVEEDKRFKEHYLREIPDTLSELCLTIANVHGEIEWLLNVEDKHENAFAVEEQNTVRSVLDEISSILERSRQHHLLDGVVSSTSDAVFVVDKNGMVIEAYPGVTALLGHEPKSLKNQPFQQLLRAGEFFDIADRKSVETSLRQTDGTMLDVLISVAPLPADIGGAVIIAKDMLPQKQAERLGALQNIYGEIAYQTKTPLCLAAAGLERIFNDGADEKTIERCKMIQRQLGQVELTYDRLFLAASKGEAVPFRSTTFHLKELMDSISENLPTNHPFLKIDYTDGDLMLQGDLFQLWFSIMSPIAYMLRFAPEEQPVCLDVSQQDSELKVKITAAIPSCFQNNSQQNVLKAHVAKALVEVQAGEQIIKRFIKNHDGTFKLEEKPDQLTASFSIPLPGKSQ